CANISLDIDSNQEVVDVCGAWKEEQQNAAIKSSIDTARRYGISDDRILADIISQFGLTKEEARSYLMKESA
ncbi:MAG: hypothetical protein LUE87_00850, partial [Lachnospiraceae bacterium]|nr:hypothetical protein [Lachnospiraceae bacterium]